VDKRGRRWPDAAFDRVVALTKPRLSRRGFVFRNVSATRRRAGRFSRSRRSQMWNHSGHGACIVLFSSGRPIDLAWLCTSIHVPARPWWRRRIFSGDGQFQAIVTARQPADHV